MKKLLFLIIAAVLGLWLATLFVPGVSVTVLADSNFFGVKLTALWEVFLLLGIILGLINFFVKPILNLITLPLRIITLGLFSVIINAVILWLLDTVFRELSVPLYLPLIETSIIMLILNSFVGIAIKD
jgi:putative membrane protein